MSSSRSEAPLYSALFNDLYQLRMAYAYDAEGMQGEAVFELFFRQLPEQWNYLVAAGLADVLDCLENFHFQDHERDYLRDQNSFPAEFLERLATVRFTGDVDACPEGTIVFPHEPLLQIRAPIREGQLVETCVLNQVHYQSLLAAKASRVVTAAADCSLFDFGSRRAHGSEAALKAARAAYLVGAAGSSNVLAGLRFGLPIFGTMAHSYVQAHDDEMTALENFTRFFPETTLLVDTYDALQGVEKVIELARRQGPAFTVRAIRLDSGDLAALSREARKRLDAAGLTHVKILASGGLDEYKLRDLRAANAAIDGYGVGTNMVVSQDAPAIDMAYKLVEYDGRPRVKLSATKAIYPWKKQVFRTLVDGKMVRDTIAAAGEDCLGTPLLQPVMRGGRTLPEARTPLEQARQHARQQRDLLPPELLSLIPAPAPYPVHVTPWLQQERDQLQTARQNSVD